MSECEWVWAQCPTPATQKPRRSAHCATPATQKRRRPKGRQGVHPTPWQCTLCHACHAKEAETQGTPGRTSDPLAVHIVPRLPRKRGGDPRDARAYIRPLGSAHCPTPATQKRRRPKGRQGVHPTPWQCTLCHACHAKEAETRGTPGRTSDPLAMHIVPRLPRKRDGDPRELGRTSDPLAVHIVPRLPRKRGGDPRDARAYIRPLGSAHCATPATQKRRRPKGRQGVHPTPLQCTLCHACHAKEAETQGTPGRTSDPLAVHIVPRLPRKRGGDPRDARAYIRPLGSAHCPTPATQKRRRPKGRQGVHPTPWQCTLCHACHAKEAETQGTPGRTSDPLAVHIVPRLPRKRGRDPRDARAYIRPLGSAHCPTPATQKKRRPKGRQGVHPTPWQCTLSHACHAKEAETQGTPGRTSDPLAVHIVPRLPRKSGGDPRDARAYIRPLGSAHCATPATQKRRRPKGRQGVHPTPWQCTLCHACHAKCTWVSVWVSEWVCEWVSEWVCEWVSEWVTLFPHFPWLFLPIFSQHLRNQRTWGLDNEMCGEKYMARGGLKCPWAIRAIDAFVVRRMMEPPHIWAMETRNGFILENWEILRTSHGGIGTPLLSSYPCDIFDAQVDILQSYRDWHGFVWKFGHHSSLSGWNSE